MRMGLGRRSLQADAAYCLAAGLALVGFRRAVGRRVAVPAAVVGAAGAATVVWAGAVGAMSRGGLRRSLVTVGAANAVAATALIAAGARLPDTLGRRLLLASGLEVAAFAGTQALALGRPRNRAA